MAPPSGKCPHTHRIIISIGPEIVSNFALTINYTMARNFTGQIDIFTKSI